MRRHRWKHITVAVRASRAPHRSPVHRVIQQCRPIQRQCRVRAGQIHILPFARLVAVIQRHQYRNRHEIPARMVHVRKAPTRGWHIRQRGLKCQPRHCLHHRPPRLEVRIWTPVPEAAVGNIDNVRLNAPHLFVWKPPPLHHARAEVLRDNIADGDYLAHNLLAALTFRIQRYPQLLHIMIVEHPAEVSAAPLVNIRPIPPENVPSPLAQPVLDANNLRPKRCEEPGRARPRKLPRKVAYPYRRKRALISIRRHIAVSKRHLGDEHCR